MSLFEVQRAAHHCRADDAAALPVIYNTAPEDTGLDQQLLNECEWPRTVGPVADRAATLVRPSPGPKSPVLAEGSLPQATCEQPEVAVTSEATFAVMAARGSQRMGTQDDTSGGVPATVDSHDDNPGNAFIDSLQLPITTPLIHSPPHGQRAARWQRAEVVP